MIIAVDIGTSSIKAGLINERGHLVTSVVYDVPLYTPEPLSAEHDLELLWKLVLESITRVSKGFENRVEAIVLSNYLHGLAILDRNYRVVQNVMTHLDRRCAGEQRIVEERGFELYSRTGCPPIFVFPLCKAIWLARRGVLERGFKLSFVKDYVVYKLTGVHVVDNGVASGTGFQNIHELKWDSLALEIAGVDEAQLPDLIECGKVVDYVNIREANLEKVAVVPGSFDGAVQNIGYGVQEENAVLNLGSTAVVRTLTKNVILDKNPEMRFFTYYASEGYRVVGGASNNGMTAVEWLRKLLGIEVLEVFEKPVCVDGIYVLPFVAGERYPFRDPNLTLTAYGLRIEHDKKHFLKGLVEGIAFTVKYIVESIEENGRSIETLHCAGGGCLNPGIVETFAHALCKPVAVYETSREVGLLGSAAIAMKALGYVKSALEAGEAFRGNYRVVKPSQPMCKTYMQCFRVFLELVKTAKQLSRVIISSGLEQNTT